MRAERTPFVLAQWWVISVVLQLFILPVAVSSDKPTRLTTAEASNMGKTDTNANLIESLVRTWGWGGEMCPCCGYSDTFLAPPFWKMKNIGSMGACVKCNSLVLITRDETGIYHIRSMDEVKCKELALGPLKYETRESKTKDPEKEDITRYYPYIKSFSYNPENAPLTPGTELTFRVEAYAPHDGSSSNILYRFFFAGRPNETLQVFSWNNEYKLTITERDRNSGLQTVVVVIKRESPTYHATDSSGRDLSYRFDGYDDVATLFFDFGTESREEKMLTPPSFTWGDALEAPAGLRILTP